VWKLMALLQKNLVWSIPIFMVAGIVIGAFIDPSPLKSLIMPLTFLMVYPMMINLQIQKVLSGGDFKVQLLTQIINFGVVPFFAFGMGKLFFADRPLIALGLLLAALLPTSGMTISWTGFAKGNISAAIKMTVIGLILGSLATPLYAKFLMGEAVEIPMASIFTQIFIIVFLPMVLGFVTRLTLIRVVGLDKYNKSLKMKFPAFSTLGVLGIVFVAMALKAQSILSNPMELFSFLVPLVILYAGNFLLSTIIGKFLFNRGDAIALVYGTVMRNLSIALAIAMTAFGGEQGSEIALIIAMAYIIQVQAAAWYVRFTDTIFGQADIQLMQLEDKKATE
jgi:arsenite transporter